MKNIVALLIAFFLAAPMAGAADDGAGVSAQTLLKRIAKEGGRQVLWQLWKNDADFERVASGIESGDPSWLKVAVALRAFSDAGASESLNYAVALALPRATNRVLALVGHGFSVADICTSPFIEPDPGVAQAYERQALAALSKVEDPALKTIAAECALRVRISQAAEPAQQAMPTPSTR